MDPTCNQAHLVPQNDSAGQQGSVLDAIAPSAAREGGREVQDYAQSPPTQLVKSAMALLH